MKRTLLLFLLLALVLNGCSAAKKPTPSVATLAVATLVPLGTPAAKYGQEVARPLIRDFTNIGSRVAGSKGEAQTAQYITTVFKALGYNPETQPFSAEAGNKTISSANVIAVKDGVSTQEIITEYNDLASEDISACLLFATKIIEDNSYFPLDMASQ